MPRRRSGALRETDVVAVRTIRYETRAYYLMGNGGCRRLSVGKDFRVDEYPHSSVDALRCRRPGRHPHAAPRGPGSGFALPRRRGK